MIARASDEAFGDHLARCRARVNDKLAAVLRGNRDTPEKLRSAMEYSVLGAGKRIRPLLVYASGELFDLDVASLDCIAASIELVHAYSLIHDDLPSMDDDDLRRGRPTTHRAFGEATAILAGDALQALAFEVLCTAPPLSETPRAQAQIIRWLAVAIGPAGMVGGQALDLDAEGKRLTEAELEDIHRRKTGQLIRASIMMPSELRELPDDDRANLDKFASDIGLVFQIRDDLLELEQDTATLGKSSESDVANDKSTYPSILGVEGARRRADAVYTRALEALHSIGGATDALTRLSELILRRSY